MRRKNYFLILVFVVVTISHVYMSYQTHVEYQKEISQTHVEYQETTEAIYGKLKKTEDNLAACVKAVVGVESGFDPMYHSVEEASRIEMIVYTDDTDSGEPRRFTMHGCQEKNGYKK